MSEIVQSVDKSVQLSYKTFGNGDKIVLAFHGFGHNKEELAWLIDHFSTPTLLIAIDVPGHGDSKIFSEKRKKNKITIEEWRELIAQILAKHNATSFHLIGYSLGGRMAMVTAQAFAGAVLSMYLFSPDGIKKTFTYRFANETIVGGWTLKKVLAYPSTAVKIVKAIGKLKLVPAPRVKFVTYQLEDESRVSKVHTVWTTLSGLWPNRPFVFFNSTTVGKIIVVFGERDPIIPASFSNYITSAAPSHVRVEIAPLGHRTLKKEGILFLQEKNLWDF